MIKGDTIAKVIVIILIAVFLGIAASNMLTPKASPTAGNAPVGAAQGAAPGGQRSEPDGQGSAPSGQRSEPGGQGGRQTSDSAGSTAGSAGPAGSTGSAGGTGRAGSASSAGSPGSGSTSRTGSVSPTGSTGPAAGRPAANAITVSVKTLQPETIRQVVKLNGDVSSQSEVNVMPDTSGKITRMVKNLGDTVQSGEVIAYIDP
ncbi:hypothetical protein EZS27_015682, partial [termite gut metagenome]